jgi:uncharacterized FAD-dependent dehydrogenase
MIRIENIKIAVRKIENEISEKQVLQAAILSKLKISDQELIDFKIFKKSIDARKKDQIFYVYTIDAEVKNQEYLLKKASKRNIRGIFPAPSLVYQGVKFGNERMLRQPVIVGMGPAGLFAGLMLSRNGYKPIILERGEDIDNRTGKIKKFWTTGILDPESNVQFGEGGAGTFSDGKLTTLINDKRCRVVLEEFIEAGAPHEIIYKSKPHIGTDRLKETVKNIRQEIIAYGGEVRFNARVTDFIIKEDKLTALIINNSERLDCDIVLLATGHSARDTYEVLYKRGVMISRKPFSIGVRIEHPQEFIDRAQYGEMARFPGLRAADYKLWYHSKNGRSAYTFCMCPGGLVVAAASEEYCLVTNGMSEYKRDGKNANSALLVGISPDDFLCDHPLAGIEFQRKWEKSAFNLGGGDYKAPAQLTQDFLNDELSSGWGTVSPSYKPGVTFAMLKDCLPQYVTDTLKEAIAYFDTKIHGFAMPDSVLTGIETRSSSPVRINRNSSHQSNITGLYPMGEGAGYAGGIMSSAVDGIKTAEIIMQKYAPFV